MLYSRNRAVCCGPEPQCPGPRATSTNCEPSFQLCSEPCSCEVGKKIVPTCNEDDDDFFCPSCAKSTACIDLVIDPETCELSTVDGITGLMLVQMAVKGRRDAEDEPDKCLLDCACTDDDGGWWYDSFREQRIGSRLWTLEGAQTTNETRLRAEQMLLEDLNFMVDAGYVDRFEVESEIDECGTLCFKYLDAFPPQGERNRLKVECLWREQTTA